MKGLPICMILLSLLVIRVPAQDEEAVYQDLIQTGRQFDGLYAKPQNRNREKAAELYIKAADLRPNDPRSADLLLRVGQLYCCNYDPARGEHEDYGKAISALEKVLAARERRKDSKYYPSDLQALIFLGECHFSSLRYEKALEIFLRFFSVDPASLDFAPHEWEKIPKAKRDAALTDLRTKRYEELKKAFEAHARMCVWSPQYPEGYARLVELQKQYPNANLLPPVAPNPSKMTSPFGAPGISPRPPEKATSRTLETFPSPRRAIHSLNGK